MKAILIFMLASLGMYSCTSRINLQNTLEPIKVVNLNISEPSGITSFNNSLYIVSDKNGTIYKTSLEGEILKKIKLKYHDLEGITINKVTQNFWVVDESKRTLISLDSTGNFLQKIKVKGKQQDKNNGLEGVCFVESTNSLIVINEKQPKQLLALNLKGKITNKIDFNFSHDISGICFDNKSATFWIVSDESQSIYNITTKGAFIKSYKIPVDKAEGVVIYNDKLFVVSDSQNKLYIFKKPK